MTVTQLRLYFDGSKIRAVALLGVLLLSLLQQSQAIEAVGLDAWITNLASSFGKKINNEIVEEHTSISRLRETYNLLSPEVDVIDPLQVRDYVISRLQSLLTQAERKVEKLATDAEGFYRKRKQEITSKLTNADVTYYMLNTTSPEELNATITDPNITVYYNAKCNCGLKPPEGNRCYGLNMDPNPTYGGKSVNTHDSAVHLPIAVYSQGPDVLQDIRWTQDLDASFREQMCADSTLTRWSHVTTRNGVMRYFPAVKWPTPCGSVDVHDGRKSVWYAQAVSSPKDALVLIDVSGSVVGLTLNLIRLLVDDVLDSLARDDFFTLVVFNREAGFLSPTCEGFIPAEPRFIEMAKQWTRTNIIPINSSSFETAFRFAFQQFDDEPATSLNATNTQQRQQRAGCNPTVFLLTDGGMDSVSSLLHVLNPDKLTRIFTFSIGKHFSSKATLHQTACEYRGIFSTIPSNSATFEEGRRYMEKVGQPLAASNAKSNKWTLPYEDILGLGRMVSVTRPVYDQDQGNVSVVAVAGTDLLYSDLQRAVDVSALGANFYTFVVENNGYLFYHPLLKKAKPNDAITVHVKDLEPGLDDDIIKSMIRGESGQTIMTKPEVTSDWTQLRDVEYHVAFAPVPQHNFSVAVAIPSSQAHRMNATRTVTQYLLDTMTQQISAQLEEIFPENSTSHIFRVSCSERVEDTHLDQSCAEYGSRDEERVNKEYDGNFARLQHCASDNIPADQLHSLLLHGFVAHNLTSDWSSRSAEQRTELGIRALYSISDSQPSVLRSLFTNETDPYVTQTVFKKLLTGELDQLYLGPRAKLRDHLKRAVLDPSTTFYWPADCRVPPPPTVDIPTVDNSTVDNSTVDNSTVDNSTVDNSAVDNSTVDNSAVDNSTVDNSTVTCTVNSTDVNATCDSTVVVDEPPLREPCVLSSRGVALTEGGVVVGAVGALLDYDVMRDQLFELSAAECINNLCEDWTGCRDSENFTCVVLDDGGVLLLSNQDEHYDQIGERFALVDARKMRVLRDNGIYTTTNVDDVQTLHPTCYDDQDADASSAVRNVFFPLVNNFLSIGKWFIRTALFFATQLSTQVLTTTQAVDASGTTHGTRATYPRHLQNTVDHPLQQTEPSSDLLHYCVTTRTVYQLTLGYGVTRSNSTGDRFFAARKIDGSNLLLVVGTNDLGWGLNPRPVVSKLVDINPSDVGGCAIGRYRTRPTERCYDARDFPESEDMGCGARRIRQLLHVITIFQILFFARLFL